MQGRAVGPGLYKFIKRAEQLFEFNKNTKKFGGFHECYILARGSDGRD
jgi:hypothetical protein